ncbi:L-2-amino-thiazoline-4-carboxylic acid hydrolase [Bacteroidota bacterium]
MEKIINNQTSRRNFLTKFVPACALTCAFGKDIFGMTPGILPQEKQQSKHIFDAELDNKITYRQLMRLRYRNSMNMMNALEKEFGKEKTIKFLKKATTERLTKLGQAQAKDSPDNSLNSYVDQFRGGYKNTLNKEIVEDSEKAFELKVTECIWASTFLDAKMGDFGNAWICHGDYAWAQGFNPKIRMVRDKTLMQGHNCCNHRYIWEG